MFVEMKRADDEDDNEWMEIDRTVLSREKENRLTEWLTESSRRGFGRTKEQLLSTVQKCLNTKAETTVFKDNMPGEKWYRLFCKRHENELSLRTPQALGSLRAAVSEYKIVAWFQKAKEDISQIDPTVLECPERLFNCDESGFQLGGGVQKRFTYDPLEGFEEAHMATSGNVWIDSEIFARWMESAFCPAVAHLQKPVILFADGHSTHLTLEIHEICRSHGIILYQLPSHSSHIIQPLDLTSFKNFKRAWYEEVMKY
ncbi:uncharacterized protein LOC106013512 [Aplysia californica]|uniref:Uncharacterized protein LOC106013512 n=1 Tax=Aplysia californica TaxID=6500 RepID=A0ABM1AC58_APLCA|nr:uncharacterized protein LOC106013512 [Aplysia californica]